MLLTSKSDVVKVLHGFQLEFWYQKADGFAKNILSYHLFRQISLIIVKLQQEMRIIHNAGKKIGFRIFFAL